MHAAPINVSPSMIQKLQTIQNSSLHVATGCMKMISIDYLHEETKLLPVHDNFFLICSQYLARTLQPNNLSHNIVTSSSGIRNMKQTLQFRFLCPVNDILSITEFKTTKSLHSKEISQFISSYVRDHFLQNSSPQIAAEKANHLLKNYMR